MVSMHNMQSSPAPIGTRNDNESIEKDALAYHAPRVETDKEAGLSQQDREYLLRRHGTPDLDPVPGLGDTDLYNWPTWKVLRDSC